MKYLSIAFFAIPGEPGLPGWPDSLFIPAPPYEFVVFLAATGMALVAVAALYALARFFQRKRRRS